MEEYIYAIVVNNGQTYSSYKAWAFENFPQEMLTLWDSGWTPRNNSVGRIVAMGKHPASMSSNPPMLVGLLFQGHIAILGESGISRFQIPKGV